MLLEKTTRNNKYTQLRVICFQGTKLVHVMWMTSSKLEWLVVIWHSLRHGPIDHTGPWFYRSVTEFYFTYVQFCI